MNQTPRDIEDWEQLLGRPGPTLAPASIEAAIAGRRVLITGAGGSIGAALARTIVPFASLLLLDSSEQALYELDRTLAGATAGSVRGIGYQARLGDAGDPLLLGEIFRDFQPQLVVHAAAFKHVPLLEQNPFAAIANNVLVTRNLLQAAQASGTCEHFLLVSTDKAVDPQSLMGASKRIAELLLLAPPRPSAPRGMQRTALRLGNVLGSAGSVVPLFQEQIARGTALTITHPEVRRFFMTIDEVVLAVLEAFRSDLCEAGSPRILVPELGLPIPIVDLARYVYRASNHSRAADAEPEIVITRLRPGDKIEEALLSTRESWLPRAQISAGTAQHAASAPRQVASPHPSADKMDAALEDLGHAVMARDLLFLLQSVRSLVPEYTPSQLLTARSAAQELGTDGRVAR